MRVNADFSRRAVIRPDEAPFVPSPMAGVERRMLDRVGEEVARATSIVRYAPGSRFDRHEHALGEEYLVLDGVFSDAEGDHPPGTYVRNPPGSGHAPWSEGGCTIFVKLRQFDPADLAHVVVDTTAAPWAPVRTGMERMHLHRFGRETVSLIRFAPGTELPPHDHPGGEEILVMSGDLSDEYGDYPAGTWIRSPAGSVHGHRTRTGCTLWVKAGHLPPRG